MNQKPYFFTIDVPLSVNECYRAGGRNDRKRFLTNEAKAWIQLAMYALPAPKELITGPVSVEYTLFFEHRYVQDVANYEKMLTDALVKRGVLKDDRYIVHSHLSKSVNKQRQFVAGAVVPLAGLDGTYTDKYGVVWN